MEMSEKVKFECNECGGHELAYQKYVKCITPVEIKDDGTLFYKTSEIDEDDYLGGVSNGFCCKDCGQMLEYCGCYFDVEKDLLDYFEIDPEVRQQQQKDYEEQLAAVIDAQVEQEQNNEVFCDDDSDLI
jgi:hypothetical protein